MNDALGEEPRGREFVGSLKQLWTVVFRPEIEAPGLLEAIGEDLELLVGGDRQKIGSSLDDLPWALELRHGGSELGALAHFVDLALAAEPGLEELFGFLRLHALPLPLRYASRVGPRATAHSDDRGGFRMRELLGFGEERV